MKRYLNVGRQWSVEEVDIAFDFSKNRTEIAERQKEEYLTKKDQKSPEIMFSRRMPYHDVSFLMPNMQAEGTKLINKFLDQEIAYCNILEVLKNDYHEKLANYADQEKIRMSRSEVEEIFQHIPDLLKFHWEFFFDIKRWSNIGRMFVRFEFFANYAKYIKNCQQTLRKMRLHIQDVQLSECLALISNGSIMPNDGLVDLLLTPLDRILEYQVFFSTLLNWADKSQTRNYELLAKTSRSIGKVSEYIEKYKYGIDNQNEMNKVQRFLGDQCNILAPTRAIVQRGMMNRLATGSTNRNKRYIFFLFNDMLLWTNKDGKVLDALQLRNCEVVSSHAENHANRKFDVVCSGEKDKVVRLECETANERNEWYEACKRTITAAKVNSAEAWSRSNFVVNKKNKEYSNNISDEEKVLESTVPWEHYENSSSVEPTEQLDDLNGRYAFTSSFKIQKFKEIDPMDDFSQISEQDVAFYQERSPLVSQSSLPTTSQSSSLEEIRTNDTRRMDDNVCIMQERESYTYSSSGIEGIARKSKDQNTKIKKEGP